MKDKTGTLKGVVERASQIYRNEAPTPNSPVIRRDRDTKRWCMDSAINKNDDYDIEWSLDEFNDFWCNIYDDVDGGYDEDIEIAFIETAEDCI